MNFKISEPKIIDESEVSERIKKLSVLFPKKCDPEFEGQGGEVHRGLYSFLSKVPGYIYEQYNKDVDTYLKKYENYLREQNAWENKMGRSFRFRIEIRNVGLAPADDVDVYFHFPDGFEMFSEGNFPEEPNEPDAPIDPRRRRLSELGGERIQEAIFRPHFETPEVSSFRIERTSSYEIRDHFLRVKHGDKVTLPELMICFDDYDSAVSFSCDYTLRPANLPHAIAGKLNFVISM